MPDQGDPVDTENSEQIAQSVGKAGNGIIGARLVGPTCPSRSGAMTRERGPVHASKQDITETIKFLTWLHGAYGRTAETCVQADVDEWLASGPSRCPAVQPQ